MTSTQTEPAANKKKGMPPLFKKTLSFTIPLLLGILILWLLYRDTNLDEMWAIIKDANFAILAFSLIFGLLGNTIRAFRWKIIITPLGYNPKVSNLAFAVYGNYAVNFALPRAGEIWRCGVVSKDEKIPFVKLFGTIIIDRILDTITVLLISFVAFLLNMEFFISYLKQNEATFDKIMAILSSPMPYTVLVLTILAVFVVFKFFKHVSIVAKISKIFADIARDMRSIARMRQKRMLVIYSLAIWASYFFYFYTTFYAFDFTANLGFSAGLFVFAISSISMGIPSNGGLGPWQATVFFGLCAFAVLPDQATAFATAVFTFQSLWVILCGLVGIFALAVKNRK